jgi:dTDP-4-dehydrorhamnose 3,5-epimerase
MPEPLEGLEGPLLLRPSVFEDARGLFFESWHRDRFRSETGVTEEFVQDNHSLSVRGVLRGLHYQLPPRRQGKLVRAVVGAVFDVVVDIRRSSPGFGRWAGVELSAENRLHLWVPPGFAHGFLSLTDTSEVLYKTTDFFVQELDRSIRWDDPAIGVSWPVDGEPILSDRDRSALLLGEAEVFS